ncbi:MAG: MFS transporter [Rhodospirillales bacterium]|nr:MFS transporter [Rhodospirillales bacterium]
METSLSRHGLNGLNFFTAAAQTGFGPFISVYLTEIGWNQTDIGLVLSVGTAAALASQVPAGALVDALHDKRAVTVAALLGLGLSALALAFAPASGWIWGVQIVHSLVSSVLTPAIAAITLALCGHAFYSERLGENARYASLGNAVAAALMGAVANYLSERMVFVLTAALVVPAIIGLLAIRPREAAEEDEAEDHPALLTPQARKAREDRPWHIFREPALHVFAVCAVLFGLANAAMLPLMLNALAMRSVDTGFVVSASIVVPQIITAAASPWTGVMAQRFGRRPVLLVGFAALPVRALLFATMPDAAQVVVIQVLDGVAGTVFGLMLPLIAADLTRRTGFLNLAIGALGLGTSLGAMFSTTLAGFVADHFGTSAAFMGLAAAGGLGTVLLFVLMPETRPGPMPRLEAPPVVAL